MLSPTSSPKYNAFSDSWGNAAAFTQKDIYSPYPTLGHIYQYYNKSAPQDIIDELKKYIVYRQPLLESEKDIPKSQVQLTLPAHQFSTAYAPLNLKEKKGVILNEGNYVIKPLSSPTLFGLYCLKIFSQNDNVKDSHLKSLQHSMNNAMFYSNCALSIYFEQEIYAFKNNPINPSNTMPFSSAEYLLKEKEFFERVLSLNQTQFKDELLLDCLDVLKFNHSNPVKPLAAQIIESIDMTNLSSNLLEEYTGTSKSFLHSISPLFRFYFENNKDLDQAYDEAGRSYKFIYDFYEENSNFTNEANLSLNPNLTELIKSQKVNNKFADMIHNRQSSFMQNVMLVIMILPAIINQRKINKNENVLDKIKMDFILKNLNLIQDNNQSVSTSITQPLENSNSLSYEKVINYILLPNLSLFSPSYQEKIMSNAKEFITSPLIKKFLNEGLTLTPAVLSVIEKYDLQGSITSISSIDKNPKPFKM